MCKFVFNGQYRFCHHYIISFSMIRNLSSLLYFIDEHVYNAFTGEHVSNLIFC